MRSTRRAERRSHCLRISILIHNVYGVGGTNRAVINLAEALARLGHDIEIVSVFRRLEMPMWTIDPRIRITPLVDTRPGLPDRNDARQWERSVIVPPHEEFYSVYSRLTDARLKDYFAHSERDIYIGTRPALNLAIAAWAPPHRVRIAQEHQTHVTLPATVRESMRSAYPVLDAAVTVTAADAEAFRRETPVSGLRLESIPNSIPASRVPQSDLSSQLLVAAGRLDPVKRYDLLVRAFAVIHQDHKAWRLRIYGSGPESGRLRRLISELGLSDSVILMGRRSDMPEEWAKAAIGISTSDRESFGMSIVEAMRCGVPVVSTRAPVGPEEIIRDGEDGSLVPVGDVDALSARIADLITDVSTRREYGSAALLNSARFDPNTVARQYDLLLADLIGERNMYRSVAPPRFPVFARSLASSLPRRTWQQSKRGQTNPGATSVATTDVHGGLTIRFESAEGSRPINAVHAVRRGEKETVAATLQQRSRQQISAQFGPNSLREGRWNVFLEVEGRPPYRLPFSAADTRSSLVFSHPRSALSSLLPYESLDGYLCIRSWQRHPHAECEFVEFVGDRVVITGRTLGLPEGGIVTGFVALRRQGTRERVEGSARSTDAPGRFEVSISMNALAEKRLTRHDDWDLYIQVGAGIEIRLARLADDIVERKPVYVYPPVLCQLRSDRRLVADFPKPTVHAKVYLTVDSELSIFVTERTH